MGRKGFRRNLSRSGASLCAHSANAEHWNEISRRSANDGRLPPTPSRLCCRGRGCAPARHRAPPDWPRPTASATLSRVEISTQILPPAHTRPDSWIALACQGHQSLKRALTERGPSILAVDRVFHRVTLRDAALSCREVHPKLLLGANAFVRTCWVRWTSRTRSLSHCASGGTKFDANTGNLRSSAQITAQLQMDRISDDMPKPHSAYTSIDATRSISRSPCTLCTCMCPESACTV